LVVEIRVGVRLMSRNRNDLSRRFKDTLEAIRLLPMKKDVLDDQTVAVDTSGKPSFQAFLPAGHRARA
jgi:ATP-dependent DNA ligase